MSNAADRYQELKKQQDALKKLVDEAHDAVEAIITAKGEAVATDGTRYVFQESERRAYTVTGKGGIMALLKKHTELDAAKLLSVTAAAVKKLPKELQAQLTFTAKTTNSIVVAKD